MGHLPEGEGAGPRLISDSGARVETIAVGQPRAVIADGREVLTSIFKKPVPGPVMVRRHNVEGDRQSDLSVHGGEFKAVYAYAAEHYAFWREALGRELEAASFGENLVIRGLEESQVAIGDVFRVGEAELEAAAPRLPCFKLGIRLGDPGAIRAFAQSRRWGIYFRVVAEGRVAVGDPVVLLRARAERHLVYDLARVTVVDPHDVGAIERLSKAVGLDPSWRRSLLKKLRAAAVGGEVNGEGV